MCVCGYLDRKTVGAIVTGSSTQNCRIIMASISSQPRIARALTWWKTDNLRTAGIRFDMPETACGDLLQLRSISWEALSLDEALTRLDGRGDFLSVDDFICILQKCRAEKSLIAAQRMYAHARRHGLELYREIENYLVPTFVECGGLLDAQQMFNTLAHRNIHSWTSLISGYVQSGQSQHALDLYQKMQKDDVRPNSYTLVAILKACKMLENVQGVHADVAEKGFEGDLFVGSCLIDMYARYGAVWDAHKVFNKLPGKNIVSWTALIAGYAEHGLGQEALKCFEQMKLQSIAPNDVTYMCLLKACSSAKMVGAGRSLQMEIIKKGMGEDTVMGSSLVDMYAKCCSLPEAHKTLDKILARDIVSWNALIAGYTEHGPGQQVLECLEQMHVEEVSPDAVTFVYALKACGNMGASEQGMELHSGIVQKGLEGDSFIGSTLVDMYAKFSSIAEARHAFDRLTARDVVSWNAIIKGCGMNHDGKKAVEYFDKMQEECVRPDAVTFTCLLSACSHARLVSKGQEIFKSMTKVHGIVPTTDHYNCMVDILSRAGRIYEATRFIETMPCSPSSDMWTSLLSACKVHAETELGFKCFEQLVKMNPEWAVPYVLMWNIYARAGRWDDAYRIEELRKQAGAKKKPASALIEVNKKVHEFVVGRNESKEVAAMLETLNSRTESNGRVPNVELVMGLLSDDAKESALCDHAEKLALAFGLLNTPQGHTLRVTKNMRMCNDCHNASKTISRMERREIIVREIYQVHCFKDGLCSCGDNE